MSKVINRAGMQEDATNTKTDDKPKTMYPTMIGFLPIGESIIKMLVPLDNAGLITVHEFFEGKWVNKLCPVKHEISDNDGMCGTKSTFWSEKKQKNMTVNVRPDEEIHIAAWIYTMAGTTYTTTDSNTGEVTEKEVTKLDRIIRLPRSCAAELETIDNLGAFQTAFIKVTKENSYTYKVSTVKEKDFYNFLGPEVSKDIPQDVVDRYNSRDKMDMMKLYLHNVNVTQDQYAALGVEPLKVPERQVKTESKSNINDAI